MAKFTIRHLLSMIAFSAVCSLLIRTDWLAAVGFAVTVVYGVIAFRLFKTLAARRLNLAMRCLALLPAVVILWFSVVDFSESIDWCAQCSGHRYISEFRVCGISVWTRHGEYHDNRLSRFRTDLGFPCKHKFDRKHLVRAWGLLYCARPCSGGTCCLSGDPDFYTEDVSKRVRQFAMENPSDAAALYEAIVKENYSDAMYDFVNKMKERTSEAAQLQLTGDHTQ